MNPFLSTLFYTFSILNSTGYDAYRELTYRERYYGLPYCIVQLQLEEQIYELFDFTYPPLVMETTQEQTNYAFVMIKYVLMHDIVACIKNTDRDVFLKYKTELRYDKMRLDFTGYLTIGLIHHYDVDIMNYPMFDTYFKITLDTLQKLSKNHIDHRPGFPLGIYWKREWYFYLEQWYAYFMKYYKD